MKKIFIGVSCLLVFVVALVYAESGRESKQLPPQEVEIMYTTEDHAYQVKDINDVVRWKVLPDGQMSMINASGNTVFNVNVEGKYGTGLRGNFLYVDTEAEAEAKSEVYDVYLIDTVTYAGHTDSLIAGVSFYLPTGNSAMDGKRITIVNVGASGTTDILVVPANDVISAAGITDYVIGYMDAAAGVTGTPGAATQEARVYNIADAYLESVEYVYRYAAAGGTWYQLHRD